LELELYLLEDLLAELRDVLGRPRLALEFPSLILPKP
jgi:hypothetical protein